jgi:hypothetical protein
MASSAGLPPADAAHAGSAAPADSGDALHSVLAAAEASLLAACALATPSAVAARGDTGALLRRVDAVSAALSSLRGALSTHQPAPSDEAGGSVSRQRQRVEFSSLPHSLVVRVLAALPADARLRCAEVCKTWRAAVCDRSLWLRVDLTAESGVTHEVTEALLRAVAKRAAGHMQALALPSLETDPCLDVLLEVLRANSASMRELASTAPCTRLEYNIWYYTLDAVQRMLRAAPQLRLFRTNVVAPVQEAVRALRNEAPFGPLRVCFLNVTTTHLEDADAEDEAGVDDADLLALAEAMHHHASLEGVWPQSLPLDTPAVVDAFIDAALARRFVYLEFESCSLSPAAAPALARLLCSSTLTHLIVDDAGRPLLDAPAAALLAAALRANTTLRCLKLDGVAFSPDADAGAAVMTALVAHPSLQELHLANNEIHVGAAAAVGAALGALVAANAPALRELHLSYCLLGDARLAPLVDALRRNTHLRVLDCEDNDMSDAFARHRFLPAIRANTSLRELSASELWGGIEDGIVPEEVLEAEALVKTRVIAESRPV